MQTLLDIDKRLREFYAQGDQGTLVISCRAADLVIPSKLLLGQAQQGEMAIMLGLGTCASVGEWLDDLVARVAADLQSANLTRMAQGQAIFDPLPLDAQDQRLAAPKRLEALMRHCDAAMDSDVPLVWGLLPLNCEDSEGYRAAIQPLLERQSWTEGHHVLVWDDAQAPGIVPELESAKNTHVAVLGLDASPPKLLNNLAATVQDPKLPEAERVDRVFQLAAVDYAYKRHDEALAKYRWVFAQDAGQNLGRQGLCLQGAGDIALQREMPEEALKYFQSALGTLLSAEQPPAALLTPVLMGAGRASMQLGDLPGAAGYFDYANRMAAKNFNAFAKADALDLRGQAQAQAALAAKKDDSEKNTRMREAMESFKACASVCCQYGYASRWESVMAGGAEQLEALGLQEEATQLKRQLATGFERARKEHLASREAAEATRASTKEARS